MERKGDAYSVNSSDQVVGRSTLCSKVNPDDSCEGASYHAFLWGNGSIADLQTLILPGSGFTVNNAVNINDRGEIAGYGTLSNGDNHVILLIPCDGNRPGVEGCDYSLVDAATVAAQSATRPNVLSTTQRLPQWRRSNRFHIPGQQSASR